MGPLDERRPQVRLHRELAELETGKHLLAQHKAFDQPWAAHSVVLILEFGLFCFFRYGYVKARGLTLWNCMPNMFHNILGLHNKSNCLILYK